MSVPLCALLLSALLLVPWPSAMAAEAESDEGRLAEMYAPRVVVRAQEDPCGPGEPYQPVAVEQVLGRADVVLRLPDGREVRGPTALDLAAAGPEAYLDFPGNPLRPGCDYARWSREVAAGQAPTLYAHLATDPDHPGRLVLQYWFFWLYNQWNNRHEGDWEMVQIVFPADTAAGALASEPISVAFAQHEGSEVADWQSAKLRRDGSHIVVYPSQGSHAAYYDQSRWFGNSAEAGFGCDDTSVSPTVRAKMWQPRIVVVPDQPDPADPEFAWLTFTGRWGERQPSFNNGPTGPNTKRQWTAPVTWGLAEGRDGAVAIPAIPGPALDAFCAVTERGSLLFIRALDRPATTALLIMIPLLGAVLLWRSTVWRGAEPSVYDRERHSGQILVAALGIYARRWREFLPLGALYLAAAFAAAQLANWVIGWGRVEEFLDTQGRSSLLANGVATGARVLTLGAVVVLVVAVGIALAARQRPRVSLSEGFQRVARPPTTPLLLAGTYALVLLIAGTVLLAPLALWLLARWASAGPAAMIEGRGFRSALARSAELTERKRLRTLTLMAAAVLLVLVPGPLLGAALLAVGGIPFWLLNGIVAASYAVTLPVLGIALALQFFDLRWEGAAAGRRVFDNDYQ